MGFSRAIVMGASMAGLWTARVLADYFEHVLVLERDSLPQGPEPRKGVPQGQHIHVLLHAGRQAIEEFFPGLLATMVSQGLGDVDLSRDMAWHHLGVWKVRHASKVSLVLATRPFIEWSVRQRLAAMANVEIRDRTAVNDLVPCEDASAIIGVRLRGGEELRADLVVDATGRGSRTPERLEALGYERPAEQRIGLDLAYTSRLYKRPDDFAGDWKFLVAYPRSTRDWRGGFISEVEGNRWMVSLNGYFRDHAPADEAGFLEFARSLPRPEFSAYLDRAEPLTDPVIHKIPASRWLHYEALSRFPDNLLVLGDAVCAFNPIFGQGISVAALEARLVHRILAERQRERPGDLRGVARSVRKRLPQVIKVPWLLASSLDLGYPQTTGERPFGHGMLKWYTTRLIELSSVSPRIYQHLTHVLGLEKGLYELMRPSVSLSVLAYGLKSLFVPLEKRANTDVMPAPVGDRTGQE